MEHSAVGDGDRARPAGKRTAAARSASPRSTGGAPSARLQPGGGTGRRRSPMWMQGNEPIVGYAVAVALAVIAVLFLTITPPKSAPHQPSSVLPTVALILAGVLALSIFLANRIVSGLLAVFTMIFLQSRYVASSVVYLRKAAFFIGVGFAVWLTFRQAAAQREVRAAKVAESGSARPARTKPTRERRPKRG